MVKGVDNNGGNDIIKLKGLKQKVDLSKMEGLRKTEQNKPLFEKFDKNNNGILEQNEAGDMRTWLADAAGNKTLSKREMKKAAGNDEKLLESLSSLGKQQAALESEEKYIETNGDTTTTIMKSEDAILRYDETTDAEGNVTRTFENGNKMVMDPEGKVLSTIKILNGKEIKTEIEYQDNKKIARETIDGELSSITVSINKDGHTIDTKYNSKEDFDSNKPSEEIIDAQNQTLKKVTKFSYDSKGNVKAETTDAAGNVTTTYKDSEGNDIKAEDFDKKEQPASATPEIAGTYTVKKGEGINKIVRDALKEQGIENPTKEQFQEAKDKFLELNKDLVKIYHGKKKEWHGNKFFYVDDVVKIPKFKPTEATEEAETTEETVKPEEPTKPDETVKPTKEDLKKQLQDKLGGNFVVELGADGKIVIKDKDGLIYPKASNFVNHPDFVPGSLDIAQDGSLVIKGKNGDVLPEATKKANDAISDDEEINQIMDDGDKDNNKKLDKTEYKNYILNMLKEYEITIDSSNKAAIEKLIEESFDGIDITEKDGQLSLGELNKKAQEVIEKLTEDMESVLSEKTPNIGE